MRNEFKASIKAELRRLEAKRAETARRLSKIDKERGVLLGIVGQQRVYKAEPKVALRGGLVRKRSASIVALREAILAEAKGRVGAVKALDLTAKLASVGFVDRKLKTDLKTRISTEMWRMGNEGILKPVAGGYVAR